MKMFLGSVAGIWLAAVVTVSAQVSSESFTRAKSWDFYIGPQYLAGKTLDFDGGAQADIDDAASLVFGVGYHFNERFALDFMFSSASPNYVGTARNDAGETQRFVEDMYVSSFNLAGTYHFFTGRFTPYVSALVGFTYIDSGIETGEILEGCWWDPWYGYECYPYARTYTSNKFSYGGLAGVRYDFENQMFLKAAVGVTAIDLDTSNSATFTYGHLVVGFAFK